MGIDGEEIGTERYFVKGVTNAVRARKKLDEGGI